MVCIGPDLVSEAIGTLSTKNPQESLLDQLSMAMATKDTRSWKETRNSGKTPHIHTQAYSQHVHAMAKEEASMVSKYAPNIKLTRVAGQPPHKRIHTCTHIKPSTETPLPCCDWAGRPRCGWSQSSHRESQSPRELKSPDGNDHMHRNTPDRHTSCPETLTATRYCDTPSASTIQRARPWVQQRNHTDLALRHVGVTPALGARPKRAVHNSNVKQQRTGGSGGRRCGRWQGLRRGRGRGRRQAGG